MSTPHRYNDRRSSRAKAFGLADAIELLADPNVTDLSSEVPDEVTVATRASAYGFSGDHRGRSMTIPLHMLQRDLTASTPTAGGNLIGASKQFHSDALRGFSVVADAGVQFLDWPAGGLPSVPTIVDEISAGFVETPFREIGGFTGEGVAVTEAEPTFGAANFDPKTVGITVRMSRRLVKQGGSAAMGMVQRQMMSYLGRRFDFAFMQGRKPLYDEPAGLSVLPIGEAFTQPGNAVQWDAIVGMTSLALAQGARFERLHFVGGADVYSLLANRSKSMDYRNELAIPGKVEAFGPVWDGDVIGRVPAHVCVDSPRAMLFVGDFSSAYFLIHGGITVIVDPRFDVKGTHQITMLADVDVIVPQLGAFNRITWVPAP
jgi:hypothetical protein